MRLSKTGIGLTAVMTIATVSVISGEVAHAQTVPHMMAAPLGSSLGSIAAENDTTYRRLFDANLQIADPNVIKEGDMIRIPAPEEQLPQRSLPGEAPPPTPAPVAAVPTPSAPAVTPAAAPAPADDGIWDKLADCESDGNWGAEGETYRGGLQFIQTTWEAYGGAPGSNPAAASRDQQIAVAKNVQASQGWKAWPACSEELGLL